MSFCHVNSNRGMALMGALAATFTVGVMIAGVAKMSSVNMKNEKSTSLRSDLESVKQALDSNVNCVTTMSTYGALASSCASGTQVALRDSNGAIIVPAVGARMGSWWVAARCENLTVGGVSSIGLSIYATRPDGNGGFLGDPVRDTTENRYLFNESHPVSLIYKANARACSCIFTGNPCSTHLAAVATNTPVSCPYGVKSVDQRTASTECNTLTNFCSSLGMIEDSSSSRCVKRLTSPSPTPTPTPTPTSTPTPTWSPSPSPSPTPTSNLFWRRERSVCMAGDSQCYDDAVRNGGRMCTVPEPAGTACSTESSWCYTGGDWRTGRTAPYRCRQR